MRLSLCQFTRIKTSLFPVCPSTGGGELKSYKKVIRLAYKGCTNRPFYHVVVTNSWKHRDSQPYEQLGTYDPMANEDNQKLVAINLERLRYWVGRGARPTPAMHQLLGLIGFFPIRPSTVEKIWRRRAQEAAQAQVNESAASSS